MFVIFSCIQFNLQPIVVHLRIRSLGMVLRIYLLIGLVMNTIPYGGRW